MPSKAPGDLRIVVGEVEVDRRSRVLRVEPLEVDQGDGVCPVVEAGDEAAEGLVADHALLIDPFDLGHGVERQNVERLTAGSSRRPP